jgi:broad-specificity NMP kinase
MVIMVRKLFYFVVIVSYIEGGPGSGKITHCDRLTRIDDRLFHLNMQATFLEVASEIGNTSLNFLF